MYDIKTLNSIAPVYDGILKPDRYNVTPDIEDPDAIIVRSASMHDYQAGDKLKCIARAGAGVNNIPVDEFAERGIVVFNTPGANANAVKELAIAGLLLASRDIARGIEWCKGLKDGEMTVEKLVEKQKKQFIGPELAGKTLGVIGLGEVGVLVANSGFGLNMEVMGYDPFISIDHAWRLSRAVSHSYDLDDLLAKCDYISLHMPLTDSTRNFINTSVLKKMKPGAALLNFSRGALVNNDDIKAALACRHLRSYVTDFPSEELLNVPGVICIPHLGASTPESENNCVRMAASQIDRYLRDGAIKNSVNYPNCSLGRCFEPRIALLHQNVPNVIGSITQIIAEEHLNIDNMVNKSQGRFAYTVLEFDKLPSEHSMEMLRALDTMYRVRLILPERKDNN